MLHRVLFFSILLIVSFFSCKKDVNETKTAPALQPKAYEKILDTIFKTEVYDVEISNKGSVMLHTSSKETDPLWLFYKIENNQLIVNKPKKPYETPYNQTFVNSLFTRKIQTLDFKTLQTFDFVNDNWKKIGQQELTKAPNRWIPKKIYIANDGQSFYLFQYNSFGDSKLSFYHWKENKWIFNESNYVTSFNILSSSENSFSQTPNGNIFVKSFGKYPSSDLKYSILYFNKNDYKRQVLNIENDSILGSPLVAMTPKASKIATIFFDYETERSNIQIFKPQKNKYNELKWKPARKILIDKQTSSSINLKFIDDNTLFLHNYMGLFIYKFIDDKWQKYWEYNSKNGGINSSNISEDGTHIFLKVNERVIAYKLKK